MQIGDRVHTPRFCGVTISAVFNNASEARKQGFTEPTYYDDPIWVVVGKSIDLYRMVFAAYKK